MATREHWEVDPWDASAVWERVIGKYSEDRAETQAQAKKIFGKRHGVRCLEIGAGVGRLLVEANRNFFQAWGVDSSTALTAYSTRFLQDYANCRVVLVGGVHLPFPDNSFSFVYSFTCFQHMPDLATIQMNLYEAFRVLQSNGEICVQTVCGDRSEVGRYDGYVFYDAEEFTAEFENVGFKEVDSLTEGEWIWVRAKKKLS